MDTNPFQPGFAVKALFEDDTVKSNEKAFCCRVIGHFI